MPSERAQAIAAELLRDPAALKARIIAERARRSGSRSFAAFVAQAWQYVPQVEPLVWGWHMQAICDHLEAVARGEIPRLVINVPPGHAKSVLMAVLWPAWIWTWWPKCQFLFASYSHGFVVRDAGRCRDVINSDWYRETFSDPAGWEIRSDQNAKDNFANTAGGVRFSTSTDGQGAGLRAHIIGIDDPLNIKEANSKAAREAANDFIGKTLSQRFVDPRKPRVAMIMQRLHEEDPTGFVMQGGGWENLRLPSEFEADNVSVTFRNVERANDNGTLGSFREEFWRDPRKADGDLLFPERFTREVLEDAKKPSALGIDGYAGQHQQRPSPAGGLLFKKDAWRFWKPDGVGPEWMAARPRGCKEPVELSAIPLPEMDRKIISVDASFKETTSGSYVVIQVLGRAGPNRFVLYQARGRWDFLETCREIELARKMFPDADIYIEEKANGSAIINVLKAKLDRIEPVNPEGGKEARASAAQPYQRSGNCYLPDGAPWLPEFVEEFASFPKGKNDDQVDAYSQGMLVLEDDDSTATLWARIGAR